MSLEHFSLAALTALALVGAQGGSCHREPTPRPEPAPLGDSAAPGDCSAACSHLRDLGCPAGQPTPKGASCEEVCQSTEDSGVVTLNPACVARAASCDAVDNCTRQR